MNLLLIYLHKMGNLSCTSSTCVSKESKASLYRVQHTDETDKPIEQAVKEQPSIVSYESKQTTTLNNYFTPNHGIRCILFDMIKSAEKWIDNAPINYNLPSGNTGPRGTNGRCCMCVDSFPEETSSLPIQKMLDYIDQLKKWSEDKPKYVGLPGLKGRRGLKGSCRTCTHSCIYPDDIESRIDNILRSGKKGVDGPRGDRGPSCDCKFAIYKR